MAAWLIILPENTNGGRHRAWTLQYYGVYAEAIDRLYALVPKIPRLGDTESIPELPVYLHYFTGTADYFISEFDGKDTFYGKERFNVYPNKEEYRMFSLSGLKSNEFLRLDFGWVVEKIFA